MLSAAMLAGCLAPQPDADLALRTATGNTLGSCGRCHAYPPPDRNHEFHLVKAPNTSAFPHSITCYDCHGASILADTTDILDTVFRGAFGEELRSSEFPDEPRIRALEILRIDSVAVAEPVPYAGQEAGQERFEAARRMFKTAAAHMDGRLDVVMHPAPGKVPRWNAEKLTCSAVSCHTSGLDYDLDIGPAGQPPGPPDAGATLGSGP